MFFFFFLEYGVVFTTEMYNEMILTIFCVLGCRFSATEGDVDLVTDN